MKQIIWDGQTKKTVKSYAPEVKKELGTLLLLLQKGFSLSMPQSRPIRSLHKSAFELRIKDKNGIYRVLYVLINKDSIFIPHAFIKKTQKIPNKEIQLAKKRLRRLINENQSTS